MRILEDLRDRGYEGGRDAVRRHAATSVVVPCRLQSYAVVAGCTGFIGRFFCARPSAWICVCSWTDSTAAWRGGFMCDRVMSRIYCSEPGSSEILNFRRCGATRLPDRMRCAVDGAMPTSAAKARTVQRVFLLGGGDCAISTSLFTVASGTGGCPGGRVLSRRRPSTPSSMNRACQRHTVGFAVPVLSMIAIVPKPLLDSRMIRARTACFCLLLPSFAIASSCLRCSSETSNSTPVRIVLPPVRPAALASELLESCVKIKPLDAVLRTRWACLRAKLQNIGDATRELEGTGSSLRKKTMPWSLTERQIRGLAKPIRHATTPLSRTFSASVGFQMKISQKRRSKFLSLAAGSFRIACFPERDHPNSMRGVRMIASGGAHSLQ